jgi:hypothetical protein
MSKSNTIAGCGVLTYNPCTEEAKAGRLRGWGQSGLQSKILSQKTKTKTKTKHPEINQKKHPKNQRTKVRI